MIGFLPLSFTLRTAARISSMVSALAWSWILYAICLASGIPGSRSVLQNQQTTMHAAGPVRFSVLVLLRPTAASHKPCRFVIDFNFQPSRGYLRLTYHLVARL